MNDYIHHIPGRMRVRCASIRRNPAAAPALKADLEKHPGVRSVEIRPLTGSLVIRYDPATANLAALLDVLPATRWTASGPSALGRPDLRGAVAKAVIGVAVQTAVEQSLIALAAALL
jgi:copper chaperone CopZ